MCEIIRASEVKFSIMEMCVSVVCAISVEILVSLYNSWHVNSRKDYHLLP